MTAKAIAIRAHSGSFGCRLLIVDFNFWLCAAVKLRRRHVCKLQAPSIVAVGICTRYSLGGARLSQWATISCIIGGMRMLLIVVLTLIFVPRSLAAAEIYLSPDGAGNRDGTSWEHALDQASLGRVVNELLKPGDRLLLGGGEYRDVELTISAGGEAGKPKTIVGVDRGAGFPVFKSQWSVDQPTHGRAAIRIAAGVGQVTLEQLRIHGYVFGVQAGPTSEGVGREHLHFDDVDIEQVRHGYYVSDCDDLQLTDCDVKRYSKHGIRCEQGCDRVVMRRCTADCSEGDTEWEKKTELFPFGFIINDGGRPNTALRFEDCLAANNLMPLQKTKYKNGDGFVIEGNSRDVTLVRCRALRNQDGGYDLKVADVRLTGCVAIRNSRNFRIWTTGTLENCFTGWAKAGIWTNGGPITVRRTTFHELAAAVQTDDKAQEGVNLIDCLVTKSAMLHKKTAHGRMTQTGTVVADDQTDPQFVKPDPAWNGLGDALNSRAFPDKGYHAEPSGK